jgi:hypothetical protein
MICDEIIEFSGLYFYLFKLLVVLFALDLFGLFLKGFIPALLKFDFGQKFIIFDSCLCVKEWRVSSNTNFAVNIPHSPFELIFDKIWKVCG